MASITSHSWNRSRVLSLCSLAASMAVCSVISRFVLRTTVLRGERSRQPRAATTLPPLMALSLVEVNTRNGWVKARLRLLARIGTEIVPILASSLHLALTQPFLVFNSTRLRAMRGGRVVAALGCLLLSPLNTVVLKTSLEMTQQAAIEAARDQSDKTLDLFQECDVIEATLQEYLQIELGQ